MSSANASVLHIITPLFIASFISSNESILLTRQDQMCENMMRYKNGGDSS